jgi:hypothetical protein
LEYVTGYKIPFNGFVTQTHSPNNPNFSQPEIDKLLVTISDLCQSGVVNMCDDVEDQFISPVFLTPKSDGSSRFILNLKNLNKFIPTCHFKMEDIRTASKLLSQHAYMANIDLKDAYFLIPIHSHHKKILRFKFHKTYEFQCLPFGLSTAPYVFTKLLKPVSTYLRERGHSIVIYLDDILCIGNSYENCRNCVTETVNLLQYLGFVINRKKSNLEPHTIR